MITAGIIVAAGLGRRMNSKIEKQFLEVHEKPLVYYAF
jgi:2-C-methyl-D-erythritol 4-phosphate cytidylyltransferase